MSNIDKKQKEIKEFYNEFITKQSETGLNKRHFSILNWAIKFGLKPTMNILEIGCGIGTCTQLFANFLKGGSISATDISEKSIDLAERNLKQFSNVNLFAADSTSHNFIEKYDVIVLPDVLEHIPMELHSKLFEKLFNCLKENGFIFIHIPNPYLLSWCHENRKDLLQVIDQPLYLDKLSKDIYSNGLAIHHMETYSIWQMEEYQVLKLRKATLVPKVEEMVEKVMKPQKVTLVKRIKYRIKKTILNLLGEDIRR
jgi:2-polyprenyl-3-methyl-5-hydroxy-6-metoxy-1,4-benzoquinol methylase